MDGLDAILEVRGVGTVHEPLPQSLVGPPPSLRVSFPQRPRDFLLKRDASALPAYNLGAFGTPARYSQLRPGEGKFYSVCVLYSAQDLPFKVCKKISYFLRTSDGV